VGYEVPRDEGEDCLLKFRFRAEGSQVLDRVLEYIRRNGGGLILRLHPWIVEGFHGRNT
jgi:hypothetical protein